MRQEVYQQFVVKILSDLRNELIDPDTLQDRSTPGLSADILSELLRKRIYVVISGGRAAKAKAPKVSHRLATRSHAEEDSPPEDCPPVPQFLQGLQRLFDWDDGYHRQNWDKYAYRSLAKHAFSRLSSILGTDDASQWRSTLGLYATEYIWVYPYYNQDRIWTFYRQRAEQEGEGGKVGK
jgi:hypothetical protein